MASGPLPIINGLSMDCKGGYLTGFEVMKASSGYDSEFYFKYYCRHHEKKLEDIDQNDYKRVISC